MVEDSTYLGNIEKATIYSDWHLSPSEMLGVAGTVLHSRKWDGQNFPNLPLNDIFTPPQNQGSYVIGNGDMFHLNPLLPHQSELVPNALSYFAEALYKQNVNGDYFKLIPGNHTKLNRFPPDVISFLSEKNILVPNGKLSFSSGDEDFFMIHGHEAQPGFYNLPFTGHPKIAKMLDNALNSYRKIHKNGDKNGQYPFPPWLKDKLNGPQKNWQDTHLPPEIKMISGHTHVPEVTETYLNSGFLDVLFGYLSYGIVEKGQMKSLIQEI
jgi:predicted phosphodiesterase